MSVSVHQIALPNPYFEGPTNAWLVRSPQSPAVLIDTGIGTEEALSLLQRELAQLNCSLKDIAGILLTHKHIDHCGLAQAIHRESGAAVYVHRDDWADVAFFEDRHALVLQLYAKAMERWGIPDSIMSQMVGFRARFAALAHSVPSAQQIRDGQLLRFGKLEFSVLHTPGHTQGSVCFLVENKLFSGDHLLQRYTPNVGATDVTAPKPLEQFLQSLQKILALPHSEGLEIYPGHGRPWTNPRPRIEKIVEHHRERTERILKILSDGQPRTAFEIAQELFGAMREHHIMLGAGEVYAHLEELESAQCVIQKDSHRFQIAL